MKLRSALWFGFVSRPFFLAFFLTVALSFFALTRNTSGDDLHVTDRPLSPGFPQSGGPNSIPRAFTLLTVLSDLNTKYSPLQTHCCTEDQDTVQKWLSKGFKNPTVEVMRDDSLTDSFPPFHFSHSFQMTAVIFRKSVWTMAGTERRMQEIAKTFAQCGVKMTKATIVEVDPPKGSENGLAVAGNTDNKNSGPEFDIATATPVSDRPIIYYADSMIDPTSRAYSNPKIYTGEPHPLLNTAWMSASITLPLYVINHDPSFSAEAHELGHLFMNDPEHYKGAGKNLMADSSPLLNGYLNGTQCALIRKSPLVKPITAK